MSLLHVSCYMHYGDTDTYTKIRSPLHQKLPSNPHICFPCCDHSRVVVDAQALTSTMAISNFTFDDAACTMYYNTTSYAIYSTGESALPTKFLKLVRKLLWIALECITLVMSTSRFCEAHAVHWSTPISYSESTSVTPIQFGRSSSACYGSLGAEHQLTATISSPICSNFQC